MKLVLAGLPVALPYMQLSLADGPAAAGFARGGRRGQHARGGRLRVPQRMPSWISVDRRLHGSHSHRMDIRIQRMCVDSAEPAKIASFWEAALGWRRTFDEHDQVCIEPPKGSPEDGVAPDILFLRVPEPKVVKNRVHLDVQAGGGRSEPREVGWPRVTQAVDRLTAAGATVIREDLRRWHPGPCGDGRPGRKRVLRALNHGLHCKGASVR
jgi:hypothetical protein